MANYIVLEMDLNDKWWDKWFVVGGLSIDRKYPVESLQLFQHEFHVHVDSWGGHGKERILCKKTKRKSERLLVQIGHNWCDR